MLIILFNYLAVISFSTAFDEPDNAPEYVPCERGWYYWGEKCYKAWGRKQHGIISWKSALDACRSYGGDLVSINSQEEQDFIVTFLQLGVKTLTWIGLNDRDKEGDYKWSDGSVFNYNNWKQNEPNDGSGHENCIHLWFEPGNNFIGYWNDIPCDWQEGYICEMKPTFGTLLEILSSIHQNILGSTATDPKKRSPNPMHCSSEESKGWKWEDSCYHVVTEKKSWQNAEKHCKNYYNGHLVSILDRLEDVFLDYISANIKEELWIGIQTQEGLQQKWTSGWYVSYDRFEKEILFREGTCVARKWQGDWITIPCTKELSFICKVSKENPPVLKLPARDSHCPADFDGWRDLGGEYCYYFETEKALNFYEAMFNCKRMGGNLASLHSKEEADIILPFVKYSRLGQFFYIGLSRRWPREEDFAWTDGSAMDYENWMHNEPNSLEEKCVQVVTHNDWKGSAIIINPFTWYDVRCEEKRGYICSVKKISTNSGEDDDCSSYCISRSSYLLDLVNQSPDAKRTAVNKRC